MFYIKSNYIKYKYTILYIFTLKEIKIIIIISDIKRKSIIY